MRYGGRLVACVVASLAGHALLMRTLSGLPERPAERPTRVEVQVVPAPPPPEPPQPEPAPEPPKPTPEPPVAPTPPPKPTTKPQPAREQPKQQQPNPVPQVDAVPRDSAPTERPAAVGDTTDVPTFGISMESTSQAGAGPAVPTGNTLQGGARDAPAVGKPKPLPPAGAPVAAREVTKMPLPKHGSCPQAKYTDAAREAAVEGQVELQFVVDADGHVRDVKVLKKLGYGLDESAIAAVKACAFTPGERNGEPVPTLVPLFKYTFLPPESD
jgi:protein TonB